ncbi:flavoprotein [Usnea florida]
MTTITPRPLLAQPSSFSSPFVASEYAGDNRKHLLLASSGSVATIKLPIIVKELSRYNDLSVRIILTKAAENFLAGQSAEQPLLQSLYSVKNVDGVYRDEDEWDKPWVRGGSILHIELRRWADILVIAPLSANSMAKMTAGVADSLMLSVVRAWDTTGEIEGSRRKRIVLAPGMNTAMWRHPVTKKHLQVLEEDWAVDAEHDGWIELLRPVEKTLACGDVGDGAMREWSEIVSVIEERLSLKDKDI